MNWRAHQRQIAQDRDDGLVGIGEIVDQARQIVLEEVRALRRQIADHLDVVGAVAPGQAEIGLGAVGVERQALQTLGDGQILLGRERLRVEPLEVHAPARQSLVLGEQLLDAPRMGVEIRAQLVQLLGVVEAQVDRLLDGRQDLFGAFGQGEQPVRGQIETHRFEQRIGQDVDGEEQHDREGDPERAQTIAVGLSQFVHHRSCLNCPS